MPLKAIIDTEADIPESLKEHYHVIEDGDLKGKYRLGVDPAHGYEMDDLTGLKNSLGAARKERDDALKMAKPFDGIDPSKAREALEKYEEFSNFDSEKEADKLASARVEAATKQIVEKSEKEIADRDGRIKSLTEKVSDLLIRSAAQKAIIDAKGSPDLLLPIVTQQTRLREMDGGEFVVEVVDAAGNPRIADAQGRAMAIADLVAEMKGSEKFGRAFESDAGSGSGTQPTTGTGGTGGGNKPASKMTQTEKSEFIEKNGIDGWRAHLQKEAAA